MKTEAQNNYMGGPLGDPEHALYGDFDHIPWLQKDISHYRKQRNVTGNAPTTIWKKGSTTPWDEDPSKTQYVAGDPTKINMCMERIKDLEARLEKLEADIRRTFR